MNRNIIRNKNFFNYTFALIFTLVAIGCSSDSPTKSKEAPPVANFTATPTTLTQGQAVTFTSTSTGTINSYSWNVDGDPTPEATTASFSHTYPDIGSFTVSLTVTGPEGNNTKSSPNLITVTSASPTPTTETSQSMQEDESITINLTATDPNGKAVTFAITTDPSNGTASLSGSNVTYSPNSNYYGTDSFDYTASNGTYTSDPVTITITIGQVDDGDPTTNDISATTDEDTAVTLTLDATEIDGESYSFAIITQPINGTLGAISNNQVTYTPNENWNGEDSFTFEATDDKTYNRRNIATATITVNAINDAPVANDVSGSTDEDSSVTVTLDVEEVDGDSLTYTLVTEPENGSVSLSGSSLTYTPNQDWAGTDTFSYKANDGTEDSNTSNIEITVVNLNPDAVELNSLVDQWDGSSLNLTWSASAEIYFSKYVINVGDDDQMNNSTPITELESISSVSYSYNANQGEKKYYTLTVYDAFGGYTESSPVLGESFYKFEKSYDTGRGNNDLLDVLIATDDGGFIAAGRSSLNTGSFPYDAVYMKIDQFGNVDFAGSLGNTNTNERILGMTQASNGDIIIVGYMESSSDIDMLVARFTNSGTVLWAKYYNYNTIYDGSSDGIDLAYDVYEDTNGSIHVYGASNVHSADGYNKNYYNPALLVLDANGTVSDATYWYWDDVEYGAANAYFQSVDHSPNVGDEMVHIDLFNNLSNQWESSIAYTEINDYSAFSWIDYYEMDIDDVKKYGNWHSIYGNGANRNSDFIEHRGYTDRTEDFSYTISASSNSFYELYSTYHLPIDNDQAYLATGYGLSSQPSFDNNYRGFFFKSDNAGNFAWGYQLNAFDEDEDTLFMEIAESSIDGGVLIGGYTRETSSSDWDYYFVKYNDEGQKVIVDFDNGPSRFNLNNRVNRYTSINKGVSNSLNKINSFVVNASSNTKVLLTDEMKTANKSQSSKIEKSMSDKRHLINSMKERLGY